MTRTRFITRCRRRVSRRWDQSYFQAAYTFSKNIDATSTGNTAFNTAYNDQSNINASRGISDFNRPHRLSVSYAYELPFFQHATGFRKTALGGWQISGVSIFQNGLPFSIYDSSAGTAFLGQGSTPLLGASLAPGARISQRAIWREPARPGGQRVPGSDEFSAGTAGRSGRLRGRCYGKFLHHRIRRSGTQHLSRTVPAELGCVVPEALQNRGAAGYSVCGRLLQPVEPYELLQSLGDGYRAVPGESDQQSFRQDRRDERESAVGSVLVALGFLRTADLGPGGESLPVFFAR